MYAFTIKDAKREATLYKITPFPIFANGMRFTAVVAATYVAQMKHNTAFALVTESEALTCSAGPHTCRIRSPIYDEVEGICGVSQFFGKDPKCDTIYSEDLTDYYHTIGNMTVYSVSKERSMYTQCRAANTPGVETHSKLNGHGFFRTPTGCWQQIGDKKIFPSNEQEYQDLGVILDDTHRLPSMVYRTVNKDRQIVNLLQESTNPAFDPTSFIPQEFYQKPPTPEVDHLHNYSGYIATAALCITILSVITFCGVYGLSRFRAQLRERLPVPWWQPKDAAVAASMPLPIYKLGTRRESYDHKFGSSGSNSEGSGEGLRPTRHSHGLTY